MNNSDLCHVCGFTNWRHHGSCTADSHLPPPSPKLPTMSDGELIARVLMQVSQVAMLKLNWIPATNADIDRVNDMNKVVMDELRRREAERKRS